MRTPPTAYPLTNKGYPIRRIGGVRFVKWGGLTPPHFVISYSQPLFSVDAGSAVNSFSDADKGCLLISPSC